MVMVVMVMVMVMITVMGTMVIKMTMKMTKVMMSMKKATARMTLIRPTATAMNVDDVKAPSDAPPVEVPALGSKHVLIHTSPQPEPLP